MASWSRQNPDVSGGDLSRDTAQQRMDAQKAHPIALRMVYRGSIFVMVLTATFISVWAIVTGADTLIALACSVLGLAIICLSISAQRIDAGLRGSFESQLLQAREQVETVSDRMWELHESEQHFRGLIDALGDIVINRDSDGRVTYANQVFLELVGGSADEVIGKTLGELDVQFAAMPDAAVDAGRHLTSRDVAIERNGKERWFAWIELTGRDEETGKVSHRAIGREITGRKLAEREMAMARERSDAANEAKSRFLATVSHEIRTPMNGIIGMAKLLADTDVTPEQQTYISSVVTSGNELLRLIEDLLDFSKIEAGRLKLSPAELEVGELIENVAELLAARAYSKGIGIGCFISPDVPQKIFADRGRLRQVLINLAGNAVKFTETGGVLINATMTGTHEDQTILFQVSDTGPGLPEKDRERIFLEFEQADTTSTRVHGGAGLGLAISKKIIDAMNGSISVAPRDGGGTIFSVSVPLDAVDPIVMSQPGKLSGHRVLLLSGNAMEAEALEAIIGGNGGKVVRCASAAEALVLSGDDVENIDTVIIDAGLESESGQMLQLIRKSVPHARAITLIAPNDRGLLSQFYDNGYEAFLARPVRGRSLLRLLTTPESSPGLCTPVKGGPGEHMGKITRERTGSLKLMLAEDNDINATLATAALRKAGHQVTVFKDGLSAAEHLSQNSGKYDMVLMDLHMPVMDGLDAIELIRRNEEQNGHDPIPILVLTADGQEQTEARVMAHGANGFLTKPLDPDKLVLRVEERAA